jgi:hypothetical protein
MVASYGVGVAMTPTVLRDGVVKSQMVLNANVMREIESHAFHQRIFYLIAHECGHVHDLKVRDEAFPNIILTQQHLNFRQLAFGPISTGCWDEYAACFLSSPFSSDDSTDDFAQIFIGATKDARLLANEAIKRYRIHADISRLAVEVSAQYGNVLKLASYLLGQLHGLGKTVEECEPASAFLANHWSRDFIIRLSDALSSLMDRYGTWRERAEFHVLDDIADDLFRDGGVIITEMPDASVRVDVPFTPDTMP